MANINLTTGIITGTQIPLDGKGYFIALNDMKDLGILNYKAYTYYDTMIVTCKENSSLYVWREALENEQGILVEGFTYPAGAIANGIDYSLKTYNFFLYFDPSGEQDGSESKIISGSVYWVEGFLYRSTVINYVINGVEYFAPITDLTLDAPDLTESRIDLFAVNDSGLVEIVKGANAVYPVEPTLDLTTQLKVSLAIIPADSDIPLNVSTEQVYDENIEWTSSLLPPTTSATINLESTNGPSLNSLCIEGTDVNPARAFKFIKSFLLPTIGVSSLAFDFKSKAAEVYGIYIVLSKEGNVVSQLIVENNTFGFISTKIDNYQTANIPLSAFNLTVDEFDEVQFSFVYIEGTISSVTGFFMDNIRFVSGVNNPVSDSSYLALDDTQDTSYAGKEGYSPVVVNENSLRFERPVKFTDLYKGNAIIYGGVEHQPSISDLSYRVWATSYIINGIVYFTPVSEIVTLNAAPTGVGEKRLDVFAIAIIGEPRAIGIEGIADVSPVLPNLDQSTQVQVGFKLLDTNETVPPEIETLLVYSENVGDPVEWRNTSFPISADLNYAIDPFDGLKSISIPTPTMPRLSWTSDVAKEFNEDGSVIFSLKLNAIFSRTASIKIGISNLAETTTSILWLNIRNFEIYGVENTLKGWQKVQISLAAFNYQGTEIDKFFFEFERTPDIQIDLVEIQTGVAQPPLVLDRVTRTSELINDGADRTSTYVETDQLSLVAFSNDYNDLDNKPAGKSVQNRYADMAAMFADQANQNDALLQYVLDASGDATVDLGYAYYEYLGTTVGDITDYVKLSEEESMDVVEKTNTSEFTNDGADGTSTYAETDEVNLIKIPTDIRVIPNSVLPSTTLDVVVECKDMTSDSTVSFGTGLTLNSQAVELNKFGSFVVRANVTFDATEQAIDVTVNNGLIGTGVGLLNVLNGTSYIPTINDWTELSISAPDISQTSKLISTVLGTNNSAVWDGVVDETVDFVIKFNIKISSLGLQENSNRPNFFAIKQSGGTNIATLQYQVEGFGGLNTYTEALGGPLGQHKEGVTGITSYQEAWEWLIDNVLPEFRWNATSGELSYWRRGVQIRVFPSGLTTGTKLWFDAKYLDLVEIQYVDLSTAQAGEPYNDNYAKVGDNVSLFINDANYAPLNPISEIEVVPNSVLPSSTQDIVILGNDINENTTINISGTSTINSTIYELNKMGAPYLRANITFSATEEAIDITLDNGLVTIFSGVLNVVNGTVYEPSNIDWIITEPADVDNNSVLTQVWNSFGYAEWVKEFDNTVDYIVYYNSDVSPLGTMPLYYQYRRPQLALLNVSDDTLRFAVNLAQGSSATQYQFEYYSSDIAAWSSSKTFLSNKALGEIPIEFRFVSGIMYLYIDNVLKQTFATTITQTLKAKFEVRVLDVKNVKYTNLSTALPGDPYNDNYSKIGDNVSLFVNDVPYLKDGSNTSDLVNDGEDGINPYLNALESPYNTIIKGVASLIPTKYNLKNLFVTGTSAWTDDDADKYIKNYYVDIPNDTITFYITREYHLAIFAFNNSSSLNTITHYLDFDGFVTKPGNQTFRGNTNIQEVVFPRATGDSTFVFENNSALTKLHLPYLDIAWVQNASLLTDIDFSKAKSLINIKNIGAVGEMYAPLATVVGFNQASGITSWYLPSVETLSGNMYNNSPLTSLYAPNCKTYSALLRNANVITSLHLPNVTNASGLVSRAFESDALTEIYMPKAKSFGSDSVLNGLFGGSTIGVGCTLTVNEFLRTSNGGAMNVNVAQAISLGIKVVFAKDVNIALDNRILNASVTTTYDFDHSRASDWKLTMIADTTFTESDLPTLDKTIEFTFKLTGAFVPTFPTYWDVLGDAYDGAVWNFIAVQIHDGNSGTEEATVFISNIV